MTQHILLIGDSLTEYGITRPEGWVHQFAAAVAARGIVVPRGYSGYNTRHYLAVERTIQRELPDDIGAVFILLGSNDAQLEGQGHDQHVPLAEYTQNLTAITRRYVELNISPESIIIVTPPPLVDARWAKATGDNRDRASVITAQYAAEARSVARHLGVSLLELWATPLVEQVKGQLTGRSICFADDGLHLSPEGNAVLAKATTFVLQKLRPEFFEETGHGQAPKWRELVGASTVEEVMDLLS